MPGLNVRSTEPSVFSRTIPARATPLNTLKFPVTMILPSSCTPSDTTGWSGPVPGLKVPSSVPSAFTRAMRLRAVPLRFWNRPPSRIFPSTCNASASTPPSKPVPRAAVKAASSEPSSLRRARRRLLTLPTPKKSPPMTHLRSG